MYFFYMSSLALYFFFFFFNDTATTEIYTLSLHDALPILVEGESFGKLMESMYLEDLSNATEIVLDGRRSEEHTSELQSRLHLVCRLLLEKKKKKITQHMNRKQVCTTNTAPAATTPGLRTR